MNYNTFKRALGVSVSGVPITIVFWGLALFLDAVFSIPKMHVVPWLRWGLIIMFSADLLYLFIGSVYQLKKSQWGKTLSSEGPYQFVRHPIYSGIIYSVSGLLAVFQQSWSLLVSVLPLSIFWSWLVEKEERAMVMKFGKKYREYMGVTGQFFPTGRGMKEAAENEKK